jgi:ribonucleoside-diphosphate reductase alpha chain
MEQSTERMSLVREHLPNERRSKTWKLVIGQRETVDQIVEHAIEEKDTPTPSIIEAYLIAGEYEDGRLGEIFLVPGKEGSLMRGLLDGFATMVSISLQFGVPLEVIIRKFINTRFNPQGMTNDRQVPMATSIFDLICRKLALRYLTDEQLENLGIEDHKQKALQLVELQVESGGNSDGEEHPRPEADWPWEVEEGWRVEKEGKLTVVVNEQASCFKGRSGPADFAEAREGAGEGGGLEQGGGKAGEAAGEAQGEVSSQAS